jgi:hypothetical protein
VNIGWVVGPALGSFLYIQSICFPFYFSAGFGIAALISIGGVSFKRVRKAQLDIESIERIPFPAVRWVVLILLTAGIFLSTFVYGRFASCISQILMTQIDDITTSHIISTIVSVNATTVILFQYFITTRFSRLNTNISLLTGISFLLSGIVIFSMSGSNILCWSVGMFVFSFGEIIFVPLQYRLIDSVATTGNRALCFSFQNLGDMGGAINPSVTALTLTAFSVSMVYYFLVVSLVVSLILFLCGGFALHLINKSDRHDPS